MPKIITATLVLGLTAGAAAAIPAAQGVHMPSDLHSAATAFDKAQMEGDGVALSHLLADDYLLVNSAGAVETKADFIHDVTAPDIRLEPFRVASPIIRIWPGGAVMGGLVRLTVHDHGAVSTACLRFSDIWAHRAGGWQVIYTQASHAGDEKCG